MNSFFSSEDVDWYGLVEVTDLKKIKQQGGDFFYSPGALQWARLMQPKKPPVVARVGLCFDSDVLR